MSIIAIDCGASFLKFARINEETDDLETTLIFPTPKADEKETMLEKSEKIIVDTICRLSEGNKKIKIGFSTEMHGFVVADKDGVPLLDYISWKHEYGCEKYEESDYLHYSLNLLNEQDIKKTGMPFKAGLPHNNLFYLLKNQLKDFPREEIYFYTLGDYYIRKLSGREPYVHATNAAATGIFDMVQNHWNEEIISKLGMEKIHFPSIYNNDNKPIKAKLHDIELMIYPAIGDQQAALYGSGLQNEKTLSLNFGTGAQISVICNKLCFSDDFQTRPFFDGMYLYTIPHIPSGRALNVYFGFVKEIVTQFADVSDDKIWDFIIEEAKNNAKNNMKIDMSFFSNAVSSNRQGSISEINEHDFTVGNLFNSIFKQMAENVRIIYSRLGKCDINQLIFSGGVVRKNMFLRELMLNRFEGIVQVSVAKNETILGVRKFILNCDNRKAN